MTYLVDYDADKSDGTMYFFLDDQNGWRLVVTDAAAGSRFYIMKKTVDGGITNVIYMLLKMFYLSKS